MSDTSADSTPAGLLAAAHVLLDQLSAADLTRCTSTDLLDTLRAVETLRRRLDHADYRVIREAETRGLPAEQGHPTITRLLRAVLNLDAGEAGGRARAAANTVGLRALASGVQAPAPFPALAAAQAAGVVSQKQALVIAGTLDRLPEDVQADRGTQIETELVGYAHTCDAGQLAKLGTHLRYLYDQDGTRPSESTDIVDERQEARRGLTLTPRPDGTARLEGETTVELTELLQTVLDTTAAPLPAVDGITDARSAAQRNHDGLTTALHTALRCGDLPAHNGVSTTVILTLTTDQYLHGTGLTRTGHGHLVPTRHALTWSGGDTQTLAVALDTMREITHYGHTHRIFTANQRHALTARDAGCTAPGCPEPPSRCQAHHLTDHAAGGPTRVDNATLVCRWHHRHLITHGWHTRMINGRPHWIPPVSIDPQQRPRRNTLHDPLSAA